MRDKYLVFGSPLIENDEIDEVVDSMKSSWIGTGPKVARFENDFKIYTGSSNAIAVSSCTAALHLSMIASGVGPGDEVITTPLTFCATINAIIHAGATPVLADIDPKTMNIDPIEVEKKISKKTKAILPVHFAGRPCQMDVLSELAEKYQLIIIEDCAHAIESEFKGVKTGTIGKMGCFSFYATKNIVTGEGGMIITEDEKLACRLKILALHGMDCDAWKRFSDEGYKHYFVTDLGFKYNMMDIQAAIGIHQLKRINIYSKKREAIWNAYNDAFKGLSVTTPMSIDKNCRHSYHLYTILIDKEKAGISRDMFLEEMNKRNIGTGVHYMSIPEHPYYQNRFKWDACEFPNAKQIGRQTVSLPLSAKLSDDDIKDVINAVTDIVG